MNITAKLYEPASELSRLLCAVGKSSPISKNGMQPKPNENPIINTIKLTTGRYLKGNDFIICLHYKGIEISSYPKHLFPIEFK